MEYLGHYHPATKDKKVSLETERIKYWISKGATVSKTVHNLFVANGIINDKKVKTFHIPTKVKVKIAEEAKKKAADEAKKKEEKAKEEAAKAEVKETTEEVKESQPQA